MILPTYLPETFGGAEQQTRQLAQTLARRGAAVTLLAPRLKRSTPARESEGPVVVRRFRLREPPNLGGRHLDSFLSWNLCVAGWLWRHRRAYDVIHIIHGRLHAFPAAIAGNWLGKPVLVKPGRGGQDHFDLLVVQRKRLLGPFFARGIAPTTPRLGSPRAERSRRTSHAGACRASVFMPFPTAWRFRWTSPRRRGQRPSIPLYGSPRHREGRGHHDPRVRLTSDRYARSPDVRRRALAGRHWRH